MSQMFWKWVSLLLFRDINFKKSFHGKGFALKRQKTLTTALFQVNYDILSNFEGDEIFFHNLSKNLSPKVVPQMSSKVNCFKKMSLICSFVIGLNDIWTNLSSVHVWVRRHCFKLLNLSKSVSEFKPRLKAPCFIFYCCIFISVTLTVSYLIFTVWF